MHHPLMWVRQYCFALLINIYIPVDAILQQCDQQNMKTCWRAQGRLTDSASVSFSALATRYQTVAGTVGGAASDVRCATH